MKKNNITGGDLRRGSDLDIPNKLGTTSNSDLIFACQKLGIKLVDNKVFMNGEISIDNKLEDGNYIINLDQPGDPGTHWVAMIKKQNYIYYFDSFAVAPFFDILNIVEKNRMKIIFNSKQLQSLEYDSCGFWVLLFLYNMHKNPSKQKYEKFVQPFDEREQEKINEPLLYKKIKTLFSRYNK